jgi:CRP-like cAMP-binding protein
MEERDLGPGDVLFPSGEVIEFVYFMQNGRVQMTREGAAPWTFEGRWFLGGFEGHLDRPATRTAVALTAFPAVRMLRAAWFDLLEDSFDLTRKSVTMAAATVARLEELLPVDLSSPHVSFALPLSSGPLSLVDRLALLTEVAMIRAGGVQALADLATASREVILSGGESLFSKDAEPEYLFLVIEGEVEATRHLPEVVRRYHSREVVAGAAALGNRARDWEAHAMTSARVLAIPMEAWLDMMEEHFDLVRSTLGALGARRELLLDHLANDARGPDGIVLR